MAIKKYIKDNREKVAQALSNTGYTVMAIVIAIFIGWAVYRLWGYLVDNGFEWKRLLHLCSKDGIIKIFTAYLKSFLWTGPVFCIAWAVAEMGDILQRMVPGQGKSERKQSLIALCVLLFSALMSVVMLIPGLGIYFMVSLVICAIGHEIAKQDGDDDKKAKKPDANTTELQQLRQRVEELERKMDLITKQDNKKQ